MLSSEGGYEVLARGRWRAVTSRLERAPVEVGLDLGARVDATWRRELARAEAEGRPLWNGPIAGLARFEVADEILALTLRPTDYKTLVGTNLDPEYLKLPRESAPRADALGVTLLPVTTDRMMVLMRRSKLTHERPGALDAPGGHVAPESHPAQAALDELAEEIGVLAADVSELRTLALVRVHETEKPQLVMAAKLSIASRDVAARASAVGCFENEGLFFLLRNSRSLMPDGPVTPGLSAAISFLHAIE